jgi:hypothetical protein
LKVEGPPAHPAESRELWAVEGGGTSHQPLATSHRLSARPAVPVDLLSGPRLALAARVVGMDAAFTVHDHATVFIENDGIIDVCPPGATGPPAFADVPVVDTGGTLHPVQLSCPTISRPSRFD